MLQVRSTDTLFSGFWSEGNMRYVCALTLIGVVTLHVCGEDLQIYIEFIHLADA